MNVALPMAPVCRAARLEYLRRMLRARRYSVEELAELLYCSERTVRRDLATLSTEPFYENVRAERVWMIVPLCP